MTWFYKLRGDWSGLSWLVQTLVLVLFFAGLAFRADNLFNLGYTWDLVTTQYEWAKNTWQLGLLDFWRDYPLFFDYWPVVLIFESGFYALTIPFGGTAQQFITSLKVFNAFWDLAFTLLLVLINQNYQVLKPRLAWVLAFLFWVSPATWFVSGVWGQLDGVVAGLIVLNLIVFYKGVQQTKSPHPIKFRQNYFLYSGVLLAFTIWFKQQAMLLLPVFFIYHFSNLKLRKILDLSFLIGVFGLLVGGSGFLFYNSSELLFKVFLLGVALLVALVLAWYIQRSDFQNPLIAQILGFYYLTIALYIPLFLINPVRAGSTFFGFLSKGDGLYSVANFWTAIGSENLTGDFSDFWQPESLARWIFLSIFLFGVVFRYPLVSNFSKITQGLDWEKLSYAKIDFLDLVLWLNLISSSVYAFLPGMHSRYFHLTIFTSYLLLFLTKKGIPKVFYGLGLLSLHLSYFLNQIPPYAAGVLGVRNSYPLWVGEFIKFWDKSSNLDLKHFTAVLLVFGYSVLMFHIYTVLTIRKSQNQDFR